MTAGGRELGARRSPACSFYLAANFSDLTAKARNRSLRPEGVSLFERHPPHFSTGVYTGSVEFAFRAQPWVAMKNDDAHRKLFAERYSNPALRVEVDLFWVCMRNESGHMWF